MLNYHVASKDNIVYTSSIYLVKNKVHFFLQFTFSMILQYSPSLVIPSNVSRWHSPAARWWKVNCDAEVVGSNAALAFCGA